MEGPGPFLEIQGETGEWVSDGKLWQFDGTASWTCSVSETSGLVSGVSFSVTQGEDYFELEFVAPRGHGLSLGVNENTQRSPFQEDGHPGMTISGCGRGNNECQGLFDIQQFTLVEATLDMKVHFVQKDDAGRKLHGHLRYSGPIAANSTHESPSGDQQHRLEHVDEHELCGPFPLEYADSVDRERGTWKTLGQGYPDELAEGDPFRNPAHPLTGDKGVASLAAFLSDTQPSHVRRSRGWHVFLG